MTLIVRKHFVFFAEKSKSQDNALELKVSEFIVFLKKKMFIFLWLSLK